MARLVTITLLLCTLLLASRDAQACFASDESAKQLEGFIRLIAGFIGITDPDVKVKDGCVTLDLEISKETIENMFQSMFEDMFEGSEEAWEIEGWEESEESAAPSSAP